MCFRFSWDNQPDGADPSSGFKRIQLWALPFLLPSKGLANPTKDSNKSVRSSTLPLPASRHLLCHGSLTWIRVCTLNSSLFAPPPTCVFLNLKRCCSFSRWFVVVFLLAVVKLEAQKNPPPSKYLCPGAEASPPRLARPLNVIPSLAVCASRHRLKMFGERPVRERGPGRRTIS